jgi:hypothetical protein
MDAENIGSHAPYTQGASVDTPLWKSRYLKTQGNTTNQTTRKHNVDDVIPSRVETRTQDDIKITYCSTPFIESMGLDPMISSAAVIHELAYGRMQATASFTKTDCGYMAKGSYVPAQLDLIV